MAFIIISNWSSPKGPARSLSSISRLEANPLLPLSKRKEIISTEIIPPPDSIHIFVSSLTCLHSCFSFRLPIQKTDKIKISSATAKY